MTRRLLLMTQAGLLMSMLSAGCSRENFPLTPAPVVATVPYVLQGNIYKGASPHRAARRPLST